MVAMQQFATIVNVRTPNGASARERDRAGRTIAGAGVTAAGVRPAHAVLVINPVASRDAIPEVDQVLIRTRAVQLGQFGCS